MKVQKICSVLRANVNQATLKNNAQEFIESYLWPHRYFFLIKDIIATNIVKSFP